MEEIIEEQIVQADIVKEVEKSFIDYSMSVITDRALPDGRDGLKPVQRRILHSMMELNITPSSQHRKCARIVGDTMGKYHPHGDSSIYGALVCMSQNWYQRNSLIDGHGNFGSIDGDGAAAMRYTEARFSPVGYSLLSDIKENTVPFISNFDNSEKEPVVLPGRFPNLLVNGSEGIAVGMATKMPTHNLNEVINGIEAYINNREITTEEMVKYILAPDFPTGGLIINQADIPTIYSQGFGKIIVRVRYKIEEIKNKSFLVFYESPYGISKNKVIEKIIDKINSKDIVGVKSVVDESDKKDIRIVIGIEKNFLPEAVAEQLYLKTPLQFSFDVNNNCIVNGAPKVCSLLELIKNYVEFQEEVLTKRTLFRKNKAVDRLHIVIGLITATGIIDDVIKTIRSSKDTQEAKESLMMIYGFSEKQSIAILGIKLSKLVKLDIEGLSNEKKELESKIQEYNEILESQEVLDSLLISELKSISKKFGDKRRTDLITLQTTSKDKLLLVPAEDVIVSLSADNYIKRVKSADYKIQNRGGMGIKNNADTIRFTVSTNTRNNLIVFTNTGKMFNLPVAKIPAYNNNQKGISIFNMISELLPTDEISYIVDSSRNHKPYIVFVTKNGTLKKSDSDKYKKIRKTGSQGINLVEGDTIVSINYVDENEKMAIVSRYGKCICLDLSTVRSIGKVATGVRGMSLSIGDSVVNAFTFKDDDMISIFTENGYGKKVLSSDFGIQNRGGKGSYCVKLSNKTGEVADSFVVANDNNLLISGDSTSIGISSNDLPVLGKMAAGNKVIRNNKIVSVAIL